MLFFILAIGRQKTNNRLANHFARRIAENQCRGRVPAGHHTVEIFGDDSIRTGLNYGSIIRLNALRPAALGNVLDNIEKMVSTSIEWIEKLDIYSDVYDIAI